MYIKRIRLTNIRCCEDLSIDFRKKGASILISGDNGDGKSTVLRSIAMGLCDLTSSSGLLRELPGDLITRGKEKDGGKIDIEFASTRLEETFRIVTEINSLGVAFEVVGQELFKGKKAIKEEQFPWDKIFVTGYGAGLRTSGTQDYEYYLPVDAMYPLFKYDTPLQNPELIFRRVIDEARKKDSKNAAKGQKYSNEMHRYITQLLKKMLNLESKDKIFLTKAGIEIKSSRWERSKLKELGDGHISITNMFFDLISWWMLHLERKSIYKNRDIDGIVLIDEVEQHLHPQWQAKIMQLLREAFPKIQFIATTHSPLVISGAKDIPVLRLYHGKHDVKNVHGWLAEDVYREIMGLSTTRPPYAEKLIDDYRKLDLKRLQGKTTRSDLVRLKKLRRTLLNELPNNDPVLLTTKLANLAENLRKFRGRRKSEKC